jgi:hypothetical protein
MKMKAIYRTTNKPTAASSPVTAAHNLAPIAKTVCHHACRGYLDALRQMATETSGMITLDSVNNANKNPAVIGS